MTYNATLYVCKYYIILVCANHKNKICCGALGTEIHVTYNNKKK